MFSLIKRENKHPNSRIEYERKQIIEKLKDIIRLSNEIKAEGVERIMNDGKKINELLIKIYILERSYPWFTNGENYRRDLNDLFNLEKRLIEKYKALEHFLKHHKSPEDFKKISNLLSEIYEIIDDIGKVSNKLIKKL